MGKIKDIFIDTKDLDLAMQEIGYLKDLCDSKDQVIAYQKELINIQGESIKQYRKAFDEINNIKEEVKEIKDEKKNTKRKSTTVSKRL